MKNSITENNSQNSMFTWLYLAFALFIIPALGFNEGLKYFQLNSRKLESSAAVRELSKLKNDLKLAANRENLLVDYFTRLFSNSVSPESFAGTAREYIGSSQSHIEFAVYDKKDKLIADNFIKFTDKADEWRDAGAILRKALTNVQSPNSLAAMDKLRPLFGRNFLIPYVYVNPESYMARGFHTADLTEENNYLYWFGRRTDMVVLARLMPAELKRNTELHNFQNGKIAREISFATFIGDKLSKSNLEPTTARIAYYELKQNPEKDFIEINDHLCGYVQTGTSRNVLIAYKLSNSSFMPGKIVLAVFSCLLFLFSALLRSGHFPKKIEDLSLLPQICVLMIISAGIPMVILGAIALSYFSNKQASLIREKNQEMIAFVQRTDQNLRTEYARCNRKLKNGINSFKHLLENNFDEQLIFANLRKHLDVKFNMAFLIRKNKGNENPNAFASTFHNIRKASRENVEANQTVIFASQFLAALNNWRPPDIPPEKAILLEMLFQKPIPMVVGDMLKMEGNLTGTSWGNNAFMLFNKGFKTALHGPYNLFAMISYDPETIEKKYLDDHLAQIIRNPYGFSMYITLNGVLINESQSLLDFPELHELFLRVTKHPLSEPEIVTYKNEQHLFVCLNGAQAKEATYCAMYPVAKIVQEIRKEARELIYLSILACTILLFMLVILYLNLLLPVNRLHKAARALENRDSSFRLPEGHGDEFAEMATIFNTSISEFEELKIASIVQSRLLPAKPFSNNDYDIFGKCLPMSDLGGDYFDYFAVDDSNFAVLLGDVAGHGVGASLLMAMAKAGVICSHDVHSDPAAVLARLHQIILAIKNKLQRKVMTFQYLSVNSSSGKMIYANAGGCSPLIIEPGLKQVTELKHSGSVLGGFKKATFSNIELSLSPGSAIIFYTDGIVESRNELGIELGYEGLHKLCLGCYDSNASVFHQNILETFKNWLGKAEVGDDMTIIVMVRQNKPI